MIAPSISSSCAVSRRILATSRFSIFDPDSNPATADHQTGNFAGAAGGPDYRLLFCGFRMLRRRWKRLGPLDILQHLLAQRLDARKFLLVSQPTLEPHFHGPRSHHVRKTK